MDADVLVVGGGPVGLAVAIEARLAGLSAVVAERRDGAIDKACGEGLMPGALPELARLGVDPPGMPLHGIAYRDARHRVEHRFAGGPGRGVRRTELHRALRERAEALGVTRVAARVDALRQDAAGVDAAGVRARWLVGADGLHSTVARLSGLARPTARARRRFGQRRHYRVAPGSDLVEVVWTPRGEIYLTPVAPDELGVALLAAPGVRFEEALALDADLRDRLVGADPVSDLRGAGPLRQSTRARVAGRVLLVGDASGYVDALTGEGLRIGLGQARAVVAAIAREDPRGYERDWERVTRDFRRLTGGLVRLATSPLRGAVVPAATAMPALFAGAVERLAR